MIGVIIGQFQVSEANLQTPPPEKKSLRPPAPEKPEQMTKNATKVTKNSRESAMELIPVAGGLSLN